VRGERGELVKTTATDDSNRRRKRHPLTFQELARRRNPDLWSGLSKMALKVIILRADSDGIGLNRIQALASSILR
jgi:hypothetical protein